MGGTQTTLPLAGEPQVSIVVLAYRNAVLLERCLASIAADADPALLFETIVVANGASPEVVAALDGIRGIRVVPSERNLGFAGGCNLGARHASGDLLVLVNDDVEVEPGWLRALVATAEAHPGAGAIGSRMTFTDGTLHEAGSIVWGDGSTTAVGRGLPGDTRRWRYLREADYCSAASLLVRATAWRAVGEMDMGYHPGYCEDVDLCFALQEAGWHILYEPRSIVCHHESSSFDPVLRSFLMRRNRARLAGKWAERLARQEPDPVRPGALERAIHRARGFPRRIIAATDRLPPDGEDWLGPLVAGLDLSRHAVVVAASGAVDPDAAAPYEALGVEVSDEAPERLLGRVELLFDAVVLGPRSGAVEAAARRGQPHAAVLHAEQITGGGAPAWQDAIAAALLGRSLEWVREA